MNKSALMLPSPDGVIAQVMREDEFSDRDDKRVIAHSRITAGCSRAPRKRQRSSRRDRRLLSPTGTSEQFLRHGSGDLAYPNSERERSTAPAEQGSGRVPDFHLHRTRLRTPWVRRSNVCIVACRVLSSSADANLNGMSSNGRCHLGLMFVRFYQPPTHDNVGRERGTGHHSVAVPGMALRVLAGQGGIRAASL